MISSQLVDRWGGTNIITAPPILVTLGTVLPSHSNDMDIIVFLVDIIDSGVGELHLSIESILS